MPFIASLAKENKRLSNPMSNVHLDYLDGIRALAALFVLFHHEWISTLSMNARTGLGGLATNWLLYGHLAVDVFIVLSGFCLSLPVLRNGTLVGGASTFYKKRARRILPPYYAAILISLLTLGTIYLINHVIPNITAIGMVQNLLMLQDFFPRALSQVDPPLWSVAVEWQIYFLFPLLIWILLSLGRIALLSFSFIVSVVILWLFSRLLPGLTLSHTCPWYFALFALGIISASVTIRQSQLPLIRPYCYASFMFFSVSAIVTIICLASFPIAVSGTRSYDFHLPLTDVAVGLFVGSGLVCLYEQGQHQKPSMLLRVLSWQPLVKTGTFAYSIYLTHWPLMCLLRSLYLRILHPHGSVLFLLLLASSPIIIGLSYLFFLAFKRPFLVSRRARATPTEAVVIA